MLIDAKLDLIPNIIDNFETYMYLGVLCIRQFTWLVKELQTFRKCVLF